jgi:mRNA interferase MazF
MKDFDSWNQVKKRTDARIRLKYPKEGSVWWCKLGLNIGDEEDGKGEYFERPVLILKKFNNNLFWILPLSTVRKDHNKYYALVEFTDSHIQSCILSQIRLVDAKRLGEFMIKLKKESFENVKTAFRSLL